MFQCIYICVFPLCVRQNSYKNIFERGVGGDKRFYIHSSSQYFKKDTSNQVLVECILWLTFQTKCITYTSYSKRIHLKTCYCIIIILLIVLITDALQITCMALINIRYSFKERICLFSYGSCFVSHRLITFGVITVFICLLAN